MCVSEWRLTLAVFRGEECSISEIERLLEKDRKKYQTETKFHVSIQSSRQKSRSHRGVKLNVSMQCWFFCPYCLPRSRFLSPSLWGCQCERDHQVIASSSIRSLTVCSKSDARWISQTSGLAPKGNCVFERETFLLVISLYHNDIFLRYKNSRHN